MASSPPSWVGSRSAPSAVGAASGWWRVWRGTRGWGRCWRGRRARLGRTAVALVGWFGPRGLASVVFALLALEDLGQHVAGPAVSVIGFTVLLSVIAHGATADPLA